MKAEVLLPMCRKTSTKDTQIKAAIDLLHGMKVVTNVKPKEEKKQAN